MLVIVRILCIIPLFYVAKNEDYPYKRVFAPSELSDFKEISNSSFKSALRYGFHQTSECKVYEKAFLCMQKCIDLHYDVAYSDKYCFCTCYTKKGKAKYTNTLSKNFTKWKFGAPTTSRPAWAQKNVTSLPTSTTINSEQEIENNITVTTNFTEVTVSNETLISYTTTITYTDEFNNETVSITDATTPATTVENATTISDLDNIDESTVTTVN